MLTGIVVPVLGKRQAGVAEMSVALMQTHPAALGNPHRLIQVAPRFPVLFHFAE